MSLWCKISAQSPEKARPDANRTGEITGRVTDDAGRPAARADVTIKPLDASATGLDRTVKTDQAGKFVLSNVPAGRYGVTAYAEGYVSSKAGAPCPVRPGEFVSLTLVKGGVITGVVLDAAQEPVVGARVSATCVADAGDASKLPWQAQRNAVTDDRGIYRIYGLDAGRYVVSAGGRDGFSPAGRPTPFDRDAPTYHPSATRAAALEVTVQLGRETTGIDVRYRGLSGRTVSGTVTGAMPGRVLVALLRASVGSVEAMTLADPRDGKAAFAFSGVPDGDYDLTGWSESDVREGTEGASGTSRVTVKGTDVSGANVKLIPLASVSGRVEFEPKTSVLAGCGDKEPPSARDVVVTVAEEEAGDGENRLRLTPIPASDAVPDETGAFEARNLEAGRFRLVIRPPNEDWYVQSVTKPAGKSKESLAAGVAVKPGERITDVTVMLGRGAATFAGRVVALGDAKRLPDVVVLVPADSANKDNPFRYVCASVNADGTFRAAGVAPGGYRVTVWAFDEAGIPSDLPKWMEQSRALLRRDAETRNVTVDLPACGRILGYIMPYKPTVQGIR